MAVRSPLNNKLCDELSRLELSEAHKLAENSKLEFRDIHQTFKWYLDDKVRSLTLVLPSDAPERVRAIMQQVEKRLLP